MLIVHYLNMNMHRLFPERRCKDKTKNAIRMVGKPYRAVGFSLLGVSSCFMPIIMVLPETGVMALP